MNDKLTKFESAVPVLSRRAQAQRIQANREQNMEDVGKMRTFLVNVLENLQAGKLTFEKTYCTNGVVTRVEVGPTTSDWVNIGNLAKIVHELSYRALGDVVPKDSASGPSATNAEAPAITIILPSIVAAPRNERQEKQAKVIDLTDVTIQPKE